MCNHSINMNHAIISGRKPTREDLYKGIQVFYDRCIRSYIGDCIFILGTLFVVRTFMYDDPYIISIIWTIIAYVLGSTLLAWFLGYAANVDGLCNNECEG